MIVYILLKNFRHEITQLWIFEDSNVCWLWGFCNLIWWPVTIDVYQISWTFNLHKAEFIHANILNLSAAISANRLMLNGQNKRASSWTPPSLARSKKSPVLQGINAWNWSIQSNSTNGIVLNRGILSFFGIFAIAVASAVLDEFAYQQPNICLFIYRSLNGPFYVEEGCHMILFKLGTDLCHPRGNRSSDVWIARPRRYQGATRNKFAFFPRKNRLQKKQAGNSQILW